MIHDPALLDRLADLPTESLRGEVFRATRLSLDPLAASGSGGRWGPTGGPNVLYPVCPNLERTQEIGAAIEFLGYDGLIAPCARWDCDNLVLFPDSASFAGSLEATGREEVDWLTWAKVHGRIDI